MKRKLLVWFFLVVGLGGDIFAVDSTVAWLSPDGNAHTQYIKTNVRLTGDDRKTCTVELWFCPLSFNREHHLVEMYSGNAGRQNFLCNKSGKVSVWMGGYSDASLESNGTLPLGEWSHVAWVADGDVWRLYINGELDIEASGHAGHILDESSPDGFVIGNSRSNSPNGASDALFAEVRVWKCARTKDEIKSSMNIRLHQTWRMKQLVGYWPLSDGEEAYVANGNAVRNCAAAQISGYNSQLVAWSMMWLRDEDGYYAKGNRVAWTTTSTLPVSEKPPAGDQYAIYNLGGHTPDTWGDYGCHTNAVNTQVSAVSDSGNFTFMGWY